MGIISWDLNGSLVQELYSPEPSTGPWLLRKTPITEHPIRDHSGLGLGYYYYFIYCRTRFRNSNETNRPVDQMTRSRRKWTVVGRHTAEPALNSKGTDKFTTPRPSLHNKTVKRL